MKPPEYHSVSDVFAVAGQLRDRLAQTGQHPAAKELDDVLTCAFTTGSEALGEIGLALNRVRPIVEKCLDNDALVLLDSAVEGSNKLWNRSNY